MTSKQPNQNRNANGTNGNKHRVEYDDDQPHDQPVERGGEKGCFQSFFSCFSWCNDPRDTKDKTVNPSDPHHTDEDGKEKKDNDNASDGKNTPDTDDDEPKQPQPAQDEEDKTGVAALATQVSQNAVIPQNMAPIHPPPVQPQVPRLLIDLASDQQHLKTLVLDLDETLVHSSFKPIPNADFVISIELEGVIHRVYVLKRPGVDNFLRVVGAKFEVVVFTASLAKYADPLLDILDKGKVVKARLFREACVHHYGNYVKDLSHLGRRLENTIIIDNSPFSYMFQPDNAIPIVSWFNDKNDRQLYDLLPFLDSLLYVDDVCASLQRRRPPTVQGGVTQNMSM